MSYRLPEEANEYYRPQIMEILNELNREKNLENKVQFLFHEDYNPNIEYNTPVNLKTADVDFIRIWLKRDNNTVSISSIGFTLKHSTTHEEHIYGSIGSIDFTLNIDTSELDKQLIAEAWRN